MRKELLISDLAIKYVKTGDESYKEELKQRFGFCGFKNKEYEEFIRFESNILRKHEEPQEKNIIDTFCIIGNQNKTNIFKNKEEYEYNPQQITNKTLYTSQLIALIDEAIILTFSSKIKEYIAKNEIVTLSKEDTSNWIYYEFNNRLEYICRCANKIKSLNNRSMFEENISKLYDNEMQLCILYRWQKETVAAKNFVPYSIKNGD